MFVLNVAVQGDTGCQEQFTTRMLVKREDPFPWGGHSCSEARVAPAAARQHKRGWVGWVGRLGWFGWLGLVLFLVFYHPFTLGQRSWDIDSCPGRSGESQ